jgi:hypothetical protein
MTSARQNEPSYFSTFPSLKMTRDTKGVLVVTFHTNGGPLTFTAHDHTDFVEAFYRISQDRANKIVILTGAGGDFIAGIDFPSFGNVADPGASLNGGDHRDANVRQVLQDLCAFIMYLAPDEADICGATSHVRFTPNCDRESGYLRFVMSALPPKADMCSAAAHVRFGPILLQKSAMTSAWRLARTYSSSCLPSAR